MRRSISRREPAQTLVLFAVISVALIGAVALVVDVGRVWIAQRELQKTADSAALAGVALLPDTGMAQIQAARYIELNTPLAERVCSADPTATVTPGQLVPVGGGAEYTLSVTLECPVDFTFAQLLGLKNLGNVQLDMQPDCGCVRANATAVIGSNKNPSCPLPLAVSDINEGVDASGSPVFFGSPGVTWVDMARNGSGYAFGQLVELKVDHATATFGNFHSIEYGGSGAGPYKSQLANQCSSVPNIRAGDLVTTKSGEMTGPTQQGLQARGLVACHGQNPPALCSAHPTFDLACPDNPFDLGPNDHSGVLNQNGSVKRASICLAPVFVVVPNAFTAGGNQIQVEGFAEFFLAGWDKGNKSVWGFFVKDAPSLGDLGAYDQFGTIIIRLIR